MSNVSYPVSKSTRRYHLVSVGQIKVIHLCTRDQAIAALFRANFAQGMSLRPILVNDRCFARTGKYELISGVDRFLAQQQSGQPKVLVEIITCSRRQAEQMSKVESIPWYRLQRRDWGLLCQRLHEGGWDNARIARFAQISETYLEVCLRLVSANQNRSVSAVAGSRR